SRYDHILDCDGNAREGAWILTSGNRMIHAFGGFDGSLRRKSQVRVCFGILRLRKCQGVANEFLGAKFFFEKPSTDGIDRVSSQAHASSLFAAEIRLLPFGVPGSGFDDTFPENLNGSHLIAR